MNEVNQKNLPTKKSGIPNPKRDQIFLFFGGLENIDWGKKDMDQCFTKLIVGVSFQFTYNVFPYLGSTYFMCNFDSGNNVGFSVR